MDASSTLNDLCSSIGAVNMDEEVNSESDPLQKHKTEDMWQLKMTSLSEQNLFVFNNGLRVDCTFVVGESPGEVKEFGLHRYVLSNSSPVFDRMLNGAMAEKQDINIPDIEPQTFNHLVTYMYSGSLDITTFSVDLVVKLCYAAEKYMIVTLKKKCLDHLIGVIDPTETIRCWQLAISLHMTELSEKAREILIERTDEVLAAPTFTEQFDACSEELVLELVQQPELHINSEFDVISAVLSWAGHQVLERDLSADQPESYKNVLGTILGHLRFLSLTPKEFAQLDSALSPIFTVDEKYSMALQISLGDFSKIQDTLCQNVLKRKKIVLKVPKFVFNDNKYTLLFKVDFNIEIHGLILPDIWKQFSVTVTRGENIAILIGNSQVCNNKSLLFTFESPFIANADENYTILLTREKLWPTQLKDDPSLLFSDIFFTQLVYSEETNSLFVEHILSNKI